MSEIVNLYCDESCHLERDGQPVMVLGTVWCLLDRAREITTRLREIKVKHGLPANFELKWTKVSPSKLGYYRDVLDYFFDDDDLHLRALIADKTELRLQAFSQSHDDWYFKMYFDLLKVVLSPDARYRIYLDIKDTRSAAPALVPLADYQGDWDRYLEAIYEIYRRDFVLSTPAFEGQPLALKRHPITRGKEATFWHIVSSGAVEDDRLPDLRRFERIGWPRAIIEHAADPAVLVWENVRRGERRVCLWLRAADYLVVLAKRSTYTLFWTAYPTEREHTQRKLRKECEGAQKS